MLMLFAEPKILTQFYSSNSKPYKKIIKMKQNILKATKTMNTSV